VQRRQAERFAERDASIYAQQNAAYAAQVAPPPAEAPSADDRIEQLRQLGELKAQGILTEAEFAAEKARILG
jgi:FMN phosphatase YigB (HAD superfamily)